MSHPRRRLEDECPHNPDHHNSPCDKLTEHLNLESDIFKLVQENQVTLLAIHKKLDDTKEMLDAWTKLNGFVEFSYKFGRFLMWVAGVMAACGAIGYAVKKWVLS